MKLSPVPRGKFHYKPRARGTPIEAVVKLRHLCGEAATNVFS